MRRLRDAEVKQLNNSPTTRSQLIDLKRRISTVEYSKRLLEKKRDAIMRAIEADRRAYRTMRSAFSEGCKQVYLAYSLVRLFEGDAAIKLLEVGVKVLKLHERDHAIAGCKYPEFIETVDESKRRGEAVFNPILTSLYIEDLLEALNKMEGLLWQFINLQAKLKALEAELHRTQIKINTLQHTVLPALTEEVKRIGEILGDRERHEHFLIKKSITSRPYFQR